MINKKDLIAIRKSLSKILFNFAEVVSTEGQVIIYDGELAQGVSVYTYDENGAKIALPNGSYNLTLEDGKKVVFEVADGAIVSIQDVEMEAAVEEPVVASENDIKLSDEIESMKSKYDALEQKLADIVGMVSKINEAVLEFGSQTEGTEPKKIEIKDRNTPTNSGAIRYFDNK